MNEPEKYKLNDRGFIKLHCPHCGCSTIETTAMNATEQYDPNKKRCVSCGYAWKQLDGRSFDHRRLKVEEVSP